jgi:methionyl-tRNA formyltransferase
VTIMDMEAGLDTGPMRAIVEVPVARRTAGELTSELAAKGAELMAQVLGDLDRYPPRAQPEYGVTYASKIEKAEARLDFGAGAVAAERQVRAFNPAPGTFFELAGERVRVLAAEVEGRSGAPGQVLDGNLLIGCGADALRPIRVQRAGRAPMSAQELLRGFSIPPGTQL